MFQKNMCLIFGTVMIFSFEFAFGIPGPRIQSPVTVRYSPSTNYDPMTSNGYVKSRYGYHKLYTDAKIWSEAASDCYRDGGYLSIINGPGEAEYLRNLLKKDRKNIRYAFNDWNAFVGITDEGSEGYWYTIFGERLSNTGYSTWASYDGKVQPDNGLDDHKEDCGSVTSGATGLSDVSCYAQFAYFCELQ